MSPILYWFMVIVCSWIHDNVTLSTCYGYEEESFHKPYNEKLSKKLMKDNSRAVVSEEL